MSGALEQHLRGIRAEGRGAFVPFLVIGDPDLTAPLPEAAAPVPERFAEFLAAPFAVPVMQSSSCLAAPNLA